MDTPFQLCYGGGTSTCPKLLLTCLAHQRPLNVEWNETKFGVGLKRRQDLFINLDRTLLSFLQPSPRYFSRTFGQLFCNIQIFNFIQLNFIVGKRFALNIFLYVVLNRFFFYLVEWPIRKCKSTSAGICWKCKKCIMSE